MSTIAKLMELEAKATKGPCRVHLRYAPSSDFPHLMTTGDRNDTVLGKFAHQEEAQTTAQFRNALPALLAIAEAAEKLRMELSGVLSGMENDAIDEYDAALAQLEEVEL